MGSVALPISGLVDVSVAVTASAAQAQNTTTLLALTPSTQIDLVMRIAEFPSLAAVGAFFGTNGPEYAVATLWFGQAPQPTTISFGRWAQTAAAGQLIGAPLTLAQQAIANFDTLTDAGFSVSVDGAPISHVGTVVLTGVGNLNAVAAAINAEFITAAIGLSCQWNALASNFIFTSSSTGAISAVSFLTAPSVGATDISALLGCTAAQGGYVAAGQIAETALAAVTLFDNQYGQEWYALTLPTGVDADHQAVGPYIQASSNKHFYGVTTQNPDVLLATSTTDIAYILSQLNLTKTAVQYSSTNSFAIVSALARIMTVDYTANSSALTLMYKQEPTVVAEKLNQTQLAAVLAKNCNVFVTYQGGATIIQPGTTCATNQFIDSIMGVDNVAIQVQIEIFNALYTSPTKIPQTDAGMHQLITVAQGVLLEFVADGLIAPGTWTQAGFGALNEGDFMESGFYVYAPPIATQLASQRAARMAVPMQIAIKLAGAIQTVSASISVNP